MVGFLRAQNCSIAPGSGRGGAGTAFCSRLSVKRDLRLMRHAAVATDIPCMVSTTNGAGGKPPLRQVFHLQQHTP